MFSNMRRGRRREGEKCREEMVYILRADIRNAFLRDTLQKHKCGLIVEKPVLASSVPGIAIIKFTTARKIAWIWAAGGLCKRNLLRVGDT